MFYDVDDSPRNSLAFGIYEGAVRLFVQKLYCETGKHLRSSASAYMNISARIYGSAAAFTPIDDGTGIDLTSYAETTQSFEFKIERLADTEPGDELVFIKQS